jgi:hypothetical protein
VADLGELFPGVNLGSGPVSGGCQSPLGRHRRRRPQPALRRYRPPSATLMMLAGIRTQLGDGFANIKAALRCIEDDVARNADTLADLAETVDHLRTRITALERHNGSRPPPEVPLHSRRRPLA